MGMPNVLYNMLGKWFTICQFVLVIFTFMVTSSPQPETPQTFTGPLLLLISFDGFRWDYLNRTATPNVDSLIADGLKAKYIVDVFASKTFPNHYTIVTGLNEESHGIVGNNMYDPLWNETFSMEKDTSKWWQEGEPVWVTNQRQGGRSGVIMYPGSYYKIHGMYPTYHLATYNHSIPYNERIDIVTQLFANGSINLGVLYFNEPDLSGHRFGPESPLMDAVIERCDKTVGYLREKLRSAGLEDRINVIITSDHGMTEISPKNYTQLDNFVSPSLYYYTDNNPVIGIWPYKENDTDTIYNLLKNASPNVNVYKKEDIPEHYHYRDNRRISPILLVAIKGWSIYRGNTSISTNRGNHGYNNSIMDMHPIFVANGPSFRQGYLSEPFDNVNIYPLMCHLLGIQPSANNGSLDKVKDLLRPNNLPVTTGTAPTSKPKIPSAAGLTTGTIIGISVVGGIGLTAICLVAAMCFKQRSYRQAPTHYAPIADTSLDGIDGGFTHFEYPNTRM